MTPNEQQLWQAAFVSALAGTAQDHDDWQMGLKFNAELIADRAQAVADAAVQNLRQLRQSEANA